MVIIIGVTDLFFQAKIIEVARQVNGDIVIAKTQNAILEQMDALKPKRVIIDLNENAFDSLETVRAIKKKNKELEVIGFVSHVQRDLIARAKLAGCDKVMARSEFVMKLQHLLI